MPSLRKINCQVVWPKGTPFKEFATTYGDGIVETFIAVPSEKPQRFYIRVTSKGYIYEGLMAVVFIDGVYQCNRNRVNLVPPRKNSAIERTEIDFCMRQEERKLKDDGYYLGSDWRFDNFNTVNEEAKDAANEQFENLGIIDVIVLRCCARKGDDISVDDCDSAAESDVIGNKLTEEDDDDNQDQGDNGNYKAINGSNNRKNAKGGKKDNQKGGVKGSAKEDNDDDSVSVINVDGAADGFYGRPSYTRGSSWTSPRPDRPHYGAPSFARGQRRVHFDMGPDVPHVPRSQYAGHYDAPHSRAPHLPGLSQHQGNHTSPSHSYGLNHSPYPVQPHSVSASFEDRPAYHGDHSAGCSLPPRPQYPFQPPMVLNSAGWPQPASQSHDDHQNPPQPTLNWVQPQAAKSSGQSSNEQPQTTNQTQQSSNGESPTIDPYSGYYWDTTGWRPAIVGVCKETTASNATNEQIGSNQNSSSDWGTNANTSTNGWETNQDSTHNSNSTWDNNHANANNDGNQNSNSENNNNSASSNGHGNLGDSAGAGNQSNDTSNNNPKTFDDSWGNSDNNNSNVNSGRGDWGTDDNDKGKLSNPELVPSTLHGPHGAYHGPRIAVQPKGDTAWVSDEPPRYDVPEAIVNAKQLSKQVQRGRAYNYFKRHRKPIYIDSIEEPYARFVFKYRTKDKLPKGLQIEPGFEPTPDQATQDLQDKRKEELIAELLRFKMAYGEAAPEPAPQTTKEKDDESDAAPWNAEPPANRFLQYKLPPRYHDTAPEDSQGDNAAAISSGDNGWRNSDGASKATDNTAGWENSGTNNNTANNGWDNSNNAGNSGGNTGHGGAGGSINW